MKKRIEVEGGELALKNSNGDIAIIPKKYRLEVEGMIKDKCYGCIDKLVSSLPKIQDYAEDGTVIPDDGKKNANGVTYQEYRGNLQHVQQGLGMETSDYNLKGAWEAGLEPQMSEDSTYHMASRNPETGLLLKTEAHPTFDKMIEGEKQAGYEVYKDDNGSMYSYPSRGTMIAQNLFDPAKSAIDMPEELIPDYEEEDPEMYESRTWQETAGDHLKILSKRLLNAGKTFGFSAVGDFIQGVDPEMADYVSESTFGMVAPTTITDETANEDMNDFTQDAVEANLMFFAGESIGLGTAKLISKVGPKFLKMFRGKTNHDMDELNRSIKELVDNNKYMKMITRKDQLEMIDLMNKLRLKDFTDKNIKLSNVGNKYYRALDNPESLKRLEAFGKEYDIDLIDAFNKSKKRWEEGSIIGGNKRLKIKETNEDWLGQSGYNLSDDDLFKVSRLEMKHGKFSKKVNDFYKEKSINYVNSRASIEDYETVVWHELSHDINKSIISSSPKLQKEIDNIFVDNMTEVDLSKIVKGRESIRYKSYTDDYIGTVDKLNIDDEMSVLHAGFSEVNYVTKPTETWAFLSTNLRQDLKASGLIDDYNDVITKEIYEKALKKGSTILDRFDHYIKDKDKFIELYNKMTLALAPSILLLNDKKKQ